MLFTFRDISKEFKRVMRRWFEKMGEPAYNLYCSTLYNPSTYFENEFLTLMQAIETFHRSTYDGTYLEDEEYDKLYDKLIDVIEKEDIDALEDRLRNYLKYE